MRVLFVSHTSEVSGAERSLLTAAAALPASIEVTIAAPSGRLEQELAALGLAFRAIRGTEASLDRRPSAIVRSMPSLLKPVNSVRALLRELRPDVVHANSLRAGVVCAAAGARPLVVSIRDVLPSSARASLAQRFVANRSALVLANSAYTSVGFTRGTDARVSVLYPPIDVDRFSSADAPPMQRKRDAAPTLGIVGQLTPWKGQLEAIQTLARVRRRHPDVQLLIVGEVKFRGGRYDNVRYEASLHAAASDAAVTGAVQFRGESRDVAQEMSAIDLLLVPSWAEPFGRVVVEGMAAGRVVVATSCGGPAEVIRTGIDGVLVPPRSPAEWAGAVSKLLAEPAKAAAIGLAGRATARRFDTREHVRQLVKHYESLESTRGSSSRSLRTQ